MGGEAHCLSPVRLQRVTNEWRGIKKNHLYLHLLSHCGQSLLLFPLFLLCVHCSLCFSALTRLGLWISASVTLELLKLVLTLKQTSVCSYSTALSKPVRTHKILSSLYLANRGFSVWSQWPTNWQTNWKMDVCMYQSCLPGSKYNCKFILTCLADQSEPNMVKFGDSWKLNQI